MNPDLALLRELRGRRADREAVPMVLVLRDERAPASPATTPPREPQPHTGAALAARLDELTASLAPTRRADDMGVVDTLLQTLAYEDFTAEPT